MPRLRLLPLLVIAAIAMAGSGCVYSRLSLGDQTDEAAAKLPTTVEAERRRRARRSTWLMIAGPAELGAGALLLYLAQREDAAERLALGTVGLAAAMGGAADLLLGLADRWLPSPFVVREADGGERMLRVEELATTPPTSAVQVEGKYTALLTTRGLSNAGGPGIAHWATPRLRLRYTADASYDVAILDHGRVDRVVQSDGNNSMLFFGIGPTARADLLLGRRRHWGRYPARALFLEAGTRVAWSVERDRFLGWRGAVGFNTGRGGFLLGASQLHGRDRYPQVDLGYTMTFETD